MDKNNKVIILGAKGQLGSLISATAPAEAELYSFASNELDITDLDKLSSVLKTINPAVIINSAAYTQVDKAEEDSEKAYLVNALGPENIAKASSNTTSIIHISTDFVFDGNKRTPYTTEDKTTPLSVYGKSKLAGEQALLSLAPQRATIIRTAWLYSAEGKNFMNTMLFLMANKDELSVVSDQKGTPTSAHTLAELVWKFVEASPTPGIYHWTDKENPGEEPSWYDFACEIQAQASNLGLLNKSIPISPIPTSAYPTPATRPAYSVLDKSKTYSALGYEGEHWATELRKTLQQLTEENK